jgi:D-alanyl-D-alanine dipeptidase
VTDTIQRRPWADFAFLQSHTHTRPQARNVSPEALVDMASYRNTDRYHNGYDIIQTVVAYAYDDLIYDNKGRPIHVDAKTYAATPRDLKVNKFAKAYRNDARIWLHRAMADIVVDAALFLHKQHGWTCTIYDGLRTVDGAYLVYSQMSDEDIASGIFAAPGNSAHNKGMAVDLVIFDADGTLVEMGGNFDHLDMTTNSRTYTGLPPHVIENRIKREIAFQHAALLHGRLFAPLRSEFWDERFPENTQDHWRVLDSLARCMGQCLLSEQDEINRTSPKESDARTCFERDWEQMDYHRFTAHWQRLFDDAELRQQLDLSMQVKLPPDEDTVIYHGDFHPIYDRDLAPSGKHITDNTLDKQLTKKQA